LFSVDKEIPLSTPHNGDRLY